VKIDAGKIIRPWLILGPFYKDASSDVKGLSFFEEKSSNAGKKEIQELVEASQRILSSSPQEGLTVEWLGMKSTWMPDRRPDKCLSWGKYFTSNHVGAVFMSTVLEPDSPGLFKFQFSHYISLRAVVAVNGKIVFDQDPAKKLVRASDQEFEVELKAGKNILTVALFRLGRTTQIGAMISMPNGGAKAGIHFTKKISSKSRAEIEDAITGLSLTRDIFYPDHEVGIKLSTASNSPTEYKARIRLLDSKHEVVQEKFPQATGFTSLCKGSELKDGKYVIECAWISGDGSIIASEDFEIRKVTPKEAPRGFEKLKERKRMILEHFAVEDAEDWGAGWDIWSQTSLYALGRYDEIDESKIRIACDYINAREDAADFLIHAILPILIWDKDDKHVDPKLREMMKDAVLNFKYWVDEPGETVMHFGTENHQILFHVAEWMAGQLFPTEKFKNSGQPGLYHATKGRMYLTEWLRQRGRFGFNEWHSNSYYFVSLTAILNAYEFAEKDDNNLKEMAGNLLDYMFFNMAADSFEGVFGTAHSRSYSKHMKHPDYDDSSQINWLLFGKGALAKGPYGMGPVTIAYSRYSPPKIIYDIANDETSVVESFVRQGLLRGEPQSANFCVFRTPDYMLSGLQDFRKGEKERMIMPAQITLKNKIPIFWSCPETSEEGNGVRPDYWSGSTSMPRVIQHRNIMSLSFRLSPVAWMSHCLFEQDKMDETCFENCPSGGKWAFAKVGKGYVGIYSRHGFIIGDYGQYAGRELICAANENTWIVECGREADWGSFDAFSKAVCNAGMNEKNGAISYKSPSAGLFITGWDAKPTIDGKPIKLDGYPLVESPWAYSRFGSGEMEIRYGNERYEIWFNR